MARRPHGTGSVFQEHDHATCPPAVAGVRPPHDCLGRWVGTYEAGWTARGTRRRRKVVARTELQAKRKLVAALRKAEQAEAPKAGGKPTVKRWADQWLETTQATLRPTAWNANASLVRNWIVPTIGHRRLDQLAPSDVAAVMRAMSGAGLAAASARRSHFVLKGMLRAAVLEGHIVPQGVMLVSGPDKGENDRDAIPLLDALALLETATRRPDASRWVAALLQGMRPAECLGLTWACVDLEAATLDVSWQLKPLPYRTRYDRASGFRVPTGYVARQLDGALHLVRPKTSRGQRIIPLVPWMATALAAWREVGPSSPHGLVWPRPDGRPQTDTADRDAWVALTDATQVAMVDGIEGRRYDLYEARHTTATLLKEAGVDDETITQILGHASILSSRAYIHVNNTKTRAALDGLAATLGLALTPQEREPRALESS